MSHSPRVMLRIDATAVYGRHILAGITRFLRTWPPWSIDLDLCEFDGSVPPGRSLFVFIYNNFLRIADF
jgi:hypothetical protein